MSRLNVADIEKNTEVSGQTYAVSSYELKQGQKGPFIRCVLFDATGELTGMFFQPPAHILDYKDLILVKVDGVGDEYNGKPQVKLTYLEPFEVSKENFDWTPFVRASEFSSGALSKYILELVETIGGEYGQVVAEILFDADTFERFLDAPAAMKNHHAFKHGLAEHIVSMAGLARKAAEHYNTMYAQVSDGDIIDADLLLAGVVLHDLGKIWDFDTSPNGLSVEFNVHGVLIGHIPEIDARIRQVCRTSGISIEAERKLRHLILSHHGRKDFGSPVEPATVEALILHQLDMIDSRMNMMREAAEGLEPNEASDRVWTLGTRVVK